MLEPGDQDEVGHAVDLVERQLPGDFQVVRRIIVGRVEFERPLVVEDGVCLVVQFEVGIADVVVQVGALQVFAFDHLVEIEGVLPLAGGEGFSRFLPEAGHVVLRLDRQGAEAQAEQQRDERCACGRPAAGFGLVELAFNLGDGFDGFVIFVLHLRLAAVRRIAGVFAFVDQGCQPVDALIAHTPLPEFFTDGFLRQVGRGNQQLVGHVAGEGLVKFLVIGAAQVLVEIIFGLPEPCPCHLVCTAVLGPGHVGAPGLRELQQTIDDEENDGKRDHKQIKEGRAREKGSFFLELAVAQGNVADVLAQAADTLPVRPRHHDTAARDLFTFLDSHGDVAG